MTHKCDERCRPHQCQPLGNATIRKIHYILSGAYRRAARWRWVAMSPMNQAEPPAVPPPDPQPPTPKKPPASSARRSGLTRVGNARLADDGHRCPSWRTLRFALAVHRPRPIACHNRRRRSRRTGARPRRRTPRPTSAGTSLSTPAPLRRSPSTTRDGRPDAPSWESSVAGRIRILAGPGWPHELKAVVGDAAVRPDGSPARHRHAPAQPPPLLRHRAHCRRSRRSNRCRPARHGGGGTTTLRVYAAWVAEADQRAAQGLAARLPAMPAPSLNERSSERRPSRGARTKRWPPALGPGSSAGNPRWGLLPSGKQLGAEFGVATATAQRAVALLQAWGLVEVSRGRRAIVRPRPAESRAEVRRRLIPGL